jgi:hypothetical protein
LIIRKQETEIKIAYSTVFTSAFFPKILLGMSGCICTGLDCDEVKLVIHIRMPTSILNFLQAMRRCADHKRGSDSTNNNGSDLLTIIFLLDDIIYLHEIIYIIEDVVPTEDSSNQSI